MLQLTKQRCWLFFHYHQALFSDLTQSPLNWRKLFLSLILDLKQMEVEFQILTCVSEEQFKITKLKGQITCKESNCGKPLEGMR